MHTFNPKAYRLPEAMSLIMLALTDSNRGLTITELMTAYECATGRVPSERTIFRIIARLNEALDPEGDRIIYKLNGRYVYDRQRTNYFKCVMAGGG